jgi:hypothetical protein
VSDTAWERIREHIKISAKESIDFYEQKKHNAWCDKGRKNY